MKLKVCILTMLLAVFSLHAADGGIPDLPPPGVVETKPESIFMTDYEAAKAKAAKEGKNLLVIVSGSDWCSNCKVLDKEVLSTKEFADAVAKDWICVLIDFPKKTLLPEATSQQNAKLGKAWAITGVPTLVAVDSKGRAFGFVEGISGTTEEVLKILEIIMKAKQVRDAAFDSAEKADNEEDAAHFYNDALKDMGEKTGVFESWSLFGYDDIVEKIIKADAKNEHHCKATWSYRKAVIESRDALNSGDVLGAIKPMEDFVKDFPEEKGRCQDALYAKAMILARSQDIVGCVKTLNELIAIDPASDAAVAAKTAIDKLAAATNSVEKK